MESLAVLLIILAASLDDILINAISRLKSLGFKRIDTPYSLTPVIEFSWK